MTPLPALRLLLASTLLACLPGALHAQLSKVFVASTGNDANDGTRNAPKRNFQAAHDAVASFGSIVVLDTAGYGALTITKGVSVTVPPGVNGFVTVSGNNNGITINAGAGASVSLRGLIIEGGSPGDLNISGIRVNSAKTLTIEDCTVRLFGYGIHGTITTGLQLNVANCVVRDCNYGLEVDAQANVSVLALVTGCRVESCPTGFSADTTNGGALDATLSDCTISGSGGGSGIFSNHPNTLVRVEGSRIVGCATGVGTLNNGTVFSRGNNTLEKNTAGNTFPATYSAK